MRLFGNVTLFVIGRQGFSLASNFSGLRKCPIRLQSFFMQTTWPPFFVIATTAFFGLRVRKTRSMNLFIIYAKVNKLHTFCYFQ